MKRISLILVPALFLFASACTKSVNQPETPLSAVHSNGVSEENTRVINLGTATLTISLEPVLYCHENGNPEAPLDCDIFLDVHFTLSRPIDSTISVTIRKQNETGTGVSDPEKGPDADQPEQSTFSIMIAPKTVFVTQKTGFHNPDTENVPAIYDISNVSMFRRVD